MNGRLRFAILSRDNFTCRYCGRKAPDVTLEVDHIQPRVRGGPDHPTNLVTACWDCNHGKATAEVQVEPPAYVKHKREPRTIRIDVTRRDPYKRDLRFKAFYGEGYCSGMGFAHLVAYVDMCEGPREWFGPTSFADGSGLTAGHWVHSYYCPQHLNETLERLGYIAIYPDPAGADDTVEDGSPPASNGVWTPTGKPLRRASAVTS